MLQRAVEWVLVENIHVFVVPIALSYDRIVESNSYIAELSGEKETENFASYLRSLNSFASSLMNVQCFGRVDLGIAEPFDLLDYVLEYSSKMKESSKYLAILSLYFLYRYLLNIFFCFVPDGVD